MTKERIKEWLGKHEPAVCDVVYLCAEARREGIEEMVEAVFLELGGDVDREFLEGIAAEQLKEKGK